MGAPRIYSWNDFGSPGGVPPGSDLDKLKAIFKACLVDGYGDKPAAGWEMVHEHPNGFSITNGDGVLNIVAGAHGHAANRFGFYIAQAATDISAGLIDGVNLRSGEWIPSLQMNGPKHALSRDIGWKQWVLIADSKTVTFYNAHGSANVYNYPEHVLLLSFGEPKSTEFENNFFCVGNTLDRYRQGSILNNPADNLISMYSCACLPSGAGSGSDVGNGINTNNLFLYPVQIDTNKRISGTVPGVAVDSFYTRPSAIWRGVFDALGLSNNFWESTGKTVDVGGYELAYLYCHSQSFFITTDPRFW